MKFTIETPSGKGNPGTLPPLVAAIVLHCEKLPDGRLQSLPMIAEAMNRSHDRIASLMSHHSECIKPFRQWGELEKTEGGRKINQPMYLYGNRKTIAAFRAEKRKGQ